MAKPSKASTAAAEAAAAPQIEHTVKLAHAEDMPPVLTAMESEGWQLLHIVLCNGGMHAAYYRRLVRSVTDAV